jgi:hypothetical protein
VLVTTKLSPPVVTITPLTSLVVMLKLIGFADRLMLLARPGPEATEFAPEVGKPGDNHK